MSLSKCTMLVHRPVQDKHDVIFITLFLSRLWNYEATYNYNNLGFIKPFDLLQSMSERLQYNAEINYYNRWTRIKQ